MVKKKNKVNKPKPKQKYNPLWTIILVVVAVTLVVVTVLKLDTANAAKVATVGQPAPNFTLRTVDGKQISLSHKWR